MGAAEVRAFEEVRARQQWATLRQRLHECFDQWRGRWKEPWHEPAPTLSAVTVTVWHIRQERPGSLTETSIAHVHQGEYSRQQVHCPQCARRLRARESVRCTVETLTGAVQLERPSCYGPACHVGLAPLDEVGGRSSGRGQLDVPPATTKLVMEVP